MTPNHSRVPGPHRYIPAGGTHDLLVSQDGELEPVARAAGEGVAAAIAKGVAAKHVRHPRVRACVRVYVCLCPCLCVSASMCLVTPPGAPTPVPPGA